MMWKTLIFLAVASAVLAGKIKRHQTNYEFHIKHDYDYHKHHEKVEDHELKNEEKPEEKHEPEQVEENHEPEQVEEKQEEEIIEEKTDEAEQQNEGDTANTESEEPEHEEKYENLGYEFFYKVKDHHTHDIKGQHEKKDGDEVKGVYWLLQPDGLKRTVDYHAGKHSGFHAKVDYSKSEEQEEDEHSKPTSEYYLTHYHGYKKYIPIKEEPEEEDKQEESAQHIPIYVI